MDLSNTCIVVVQTRDVCEGIHIEVVFYIGSLVGGGQRASRGDSLPTNRCQRSGAKDQVRSLVVEKRGGTTSMDKAVRFSALFTRGERTAAALWPALAVRVPAELGRCR